MTVVNLQAANNYLFFRCSFLVSSLELAWREVIDFKNVNLCARTDHSRCALTPSGSPCGRSPSPLRGAVVEPACFLSAVRTSLFERLAPAAQIFS